MIQKAQPWLIVLVLILDAEALARPAQIVQDDQEREIQTREYQLPVDALRPLERIPQEAQPLFPPEEIGHSGIGYSPALPEDPSINCKISGSEEVRDGSTAMGMGFGENAKTKNIAECWAKGTQLFKKQILSCRAPNLFKVTMKFKKGDKSMQTEKADVCKGHGNSNSDRSIASVPRPPVKRPPRKRWVDVTPQLPVSAEPLPLEPTPAADPVSEDSASAEGL